MDLPHLVSKLPRILEVELPVGPSALKSSSIPVEVAGLVLGGALDVGLVFDELLDAQEDLLDGYAALPVLLLVKDAQADCTRGVDVGVGEDGLELA